MKPAPRSQLRSWFKPWMVPAIVIVLGFMELAVLVWIAYATSVWWAVLAVVCGWIIGFALVVAAGQQSVSRLVSVYRTLRGRGSLKSHMTRPVFTVVAALFFFFPGLITDVVAVILLLTPVQKKALARAGFSSDQQRKILFSRTRGGVIDGEIVVDTVSSSARPSNVPPTPGVQKTSPPLLEGDVLDE